MKFKLTSLATAMLLCHAVAAETDEQFIPDADGASDEKITILGQYLSVNEINSVKTPTPVIDVPQSLSIMSAEEMTTRGIAAVSQIIDYTPGVNTSQGEGHRDAVVFRGVRSTADFFVDGNRDDVQYYRALYNVDKVEILRGPNALLFGRGGTGGVLNRVTKKPMFSDQATGVKSSVTSFGGFSAEIDSNFSEDSASAYRINAMLETLENHRDFYDGERYGFNPSARFQLNDASMLDLSYEYVNHERFIDRGIPVGPDGYPVEALQDIVFADPENNYHTLDANVFRATLQHDFSEEMKGNFSAFYGEYDKVYANFYASDYDLDTNVVELDGYIDHTVRDNFILSGNVVSEFNMGEVQHTLMFGAEIVDTSSNQNRFNPVFSSTQSDRESFLANRPLDFRGLSGTNANGEAITAAFSDLNDDTRVSVSVYSAYVQDEIQLTDSLDVIFGARFDRFDISVFNADPAVLETRTRTDEEISPRGGLIFKPMENMSIYASYSKSFLPRSGEQYANINGSNNQLDPNIFTNTEIGIKWDSEDGITLTAALFDNEQSSPQVADNDPATLDVIDSEISGFELQISGHVTEDWNLTANYSSLEGEIVDRSGPTGRTPREIPETTYSLWTTYSVTDAFGLGFGAIYQGDTYINNSNTAVLPGYTRLDLAAYYDISPNWRLQFHVENLTDELYFPNAHSTHQASVGAPLNAKLTLVGTF